uniref:Uncharacterized protein n=1 Tax=Sphaerodactylus townsendi TaxID=933632 RepID=A0ACB8G5R7_9SAUR
MGNWKKPFNPKYTELREFYVDPYTVMKVPTMFQMGMFENGRDDQRACTILKMPYEGHADAYIILPDKGQMDRVVRSLSNEAVQAWKRILHKSSVDVYMPKSKVYGELNLKDIMYSIGIVDVFTEKADLSGITGQPQHRVNGEPGPAGAAAASATVLMVRAEPAAPAGSGGKTTGRWLPHLLPVSRLRAAPAGQDAAGRPPAPVASQVGIHPRHDLFGLRNWRRQAAGFLPGSPPGPGGRPATPIRPCRA